MIDEAAIQFAVDGVIQREGGFVDHPSDRGGPTKYGITKATLERVRGRPVSVEEVRNLTRAEAEQIYKDIYIRRPGLNHIEDQGLFLLLFDSAVQHGSRTAVRFLQEVLGVPADGIIGPVTLHALHGRDLSMVYRAVLRERMLFYGRIISRNPSQAVFAAGWMSRLAEFV